MPQPHDQQGPDRHFVEARTTISVKGSGLVRPSESLIRSLSATALWTAAYQAEESERPDAIFHRSRRTTLASRTVRVARGRVRSVSFRSRTGPRLAHAQGAACRCSRYSRARRASASRVRLVSLASSASDTNSALQLDEHLSLIH